jgi:hypothetical protein
MGSVWARLGVTIELPKANKEYKTEQALIEAAVLAIRQGKFKVEGDSYIPECCIEHEFYEEYSFGFSPDDDVSLGDL